MKESIDARNPHRAQLLLFRGAKEGLMYEYPWPTSSRRRN
jgi:hypothetical protein